MKKLLLFFLVFGLVIKGVSQPCNMGGIYSIGPGGIYPTLTAALNALKTNGVNDSVILELRPAYIGSTETFPLTFSGIPCISDTKYVVIRPQIGATGLNISATGGTGALFFDNASYIHVDGRPGGAGSNKELTISGYSEAIFVMNNSAYNIFQYLNINVRSQSGYRIITFSDSNVPNGGNSNNIISNCAIGNTTSPCVNNIYSKGSLNAKNRYNVISDCEILNFNSNTYPSRGIFLDQYSAEWTIAGNSIYQNNGNTVINPLNTSLIEINDSTSGGFIIKDNYLGGSAPKCGGAPGNFFSPTAGIILSTSADTLSSVQNNTISNIKNYKSFTGIYLLRGKIWCGTSIGNTIGSLTKYADINSTYSTNTIGIAVGWTSTQVRPDSTIIKNNRIGGIRVESANTFFGDYNLYGISVYEKSNSYIEVDSNTIGSSTIRNSLNSLIKYSETVIGIGSFNNTTNINCTLAIKNNVIQNLSGGKLVGISVQSDVSKIEKNTIRNLYPEPSASSSQGYGILLIVVTKGAQVNGNKIYSIKTSASIHGIEATGCKHYTLQSNIIHSLWSSGGVVGIYGSYSNNNANFYNNMIRLGYDSAGYPLSGYITGVSTSFDSANFINNSIFLGGSSYLNSKALEINSDNSLNTPFQHSSRILNNILVNNMAYTNTNYPRNCALYCQDTTNASLQNIDYNIYYANASNAYLGLWYSNYCSSITQWRFKTKQDKHSFFYDPAFINPTGSVSTVDLHLSPNNPAEGTGIYDPAITEDIDGDIRSLFSPTDIGADAGNYTIVDGDTPTITHDVFFGQKAVSSYVYQVNINDNGAGIDSTAGNKPRMWYRQKYPSISQWFSDAGYLMSGDLHKGVWGFVPNLAATGLILNPGDSLEYYFVAQDYGPPVNTGKSNTAALHSNVQTQVNPPVDPFRLLIFGTFPDTVYVGAGQRYLSLTNNNGFFEATEKNVFDSATNVTVFITSDLNESGTHRMHTFNSKKIAIKIVPGTPILKKIKNATNLYNPMMILDNVRDVTFDGGINGSGKYLQFTNASAQSSNGYSDMTVVGKTNNLIVQNCIFESNSTSSYPNASIELADDDISNVTIYQNIFRNAITASSTLPKTHLHFSTNFHNDSIYIRNNEFLNSSTAAILVQSAVFIPKPTAQFFIENNHFYSNSNPNQAGTAISVNSVAGGTFYIKNNYIGGTAPFCAGLPWVSNNSLAGISVTNADSYIDGNVIQNIRLNGSSSNFSGIGSGAGKCRIGTIIPNIIGDPNSDSSIMVIENAFGISAGGPGTTFSAGPGSIISNNIITGIVCEYFSGIDVIFSSGEVSNNSIFNCKSAYYTFSGSSGYKGISADIDSGRITGNKIYNLTNTTSRGNCYGLYVNPKAPVPNRVIVNKNSVFHISSNSYSLNYPYILAALGVDAGQSNIENNQFNLNNDTFTNNIRLYGLYFSSLTGSAFKTNVRYNTIYIGGSSTGTAPSAGVYLIKGSEVNSLRNNLIYNDRVSSTAHHLAIAMDTGTTTRWNGSNVGNNLYIVKDTSLVNQWQNSTPVDIRRWRSASNSDSASFVSLVSDVPKTDLFKSLSTGDLKTNNLSPYSWYVNGKGIPLSDVADDYDSANIRSLAISTGPTDIGSTEFTTTTQAPTLYIYGKHQLGGADTLSINDRIMAIIHWGNTGTLPTLGNTKWFSGEWPNDTTNNGTTSFARFMSSYFAIPASGGSGYTFDLTLFYDSSMFGKITTPGTMVINRRQIGVPGSWSTIVPSVVNLSSNSITISNQSTFGEFTVTDENATLPVELYELSALKQDKNVVLSWQINLYKPFKSELQRSFDGKNFVSIYSFTYSGNNVSWFTDRNILSEAGTTVYYRLKTTPDNSAVKYSSIILVRNSNSFVFKVLPNPFMNRLSVLLNIRSEQKVSFYITDNSGKMVFKTSRKFLPGIQYVDISPKSFIQTGLYDLTVETLEEKSTIKIMKQ